MITLKVMSNVCRFSLTVIQFMRKSYKRTRKPKGQSRMYNPKNLATLDTQDTVEDQTKRTTQKIKKMKQHGHQIQNR